MKKIIGLCSCLLVASANAAVIDFTGGTVYLNDGTTTTTNNSTSFQNVSSYEEDGFRLEFLFSSPPTAFSSIVGDYYNTGNDVFHAHWDSGPFGEVSEIRVTKIDGSTFNLGGFRVSTNTAEGGGPSDGNELTWVNSSKASNIFSVTPDSWGLGSGTDPLITIANSNDLFADISWFSFTNDALSSAVGLGLDNFFLDEPGDADGVDPTQPSPVPEPSGLALLGLGLIGLSVVRKRKMA